MTNSIADNDRVEAEVSGAWCLDYQEGRHKLNADSDSLILLSGLEIIEAARHSETVKISIYSPLKLLSDGSIVHSFDFALMFRSQMRRCSSLVAYYGEGELEMEFSFLSKAAERVTSHGNCFRFAIPEWSNRATLAGISGEGEFSGLAYGMMPLLMLGSYLNAGKGAAFGMGVYRIEGACLHE